MKLLNSILEKGLEIFNNIHSLGDCCWETSIVSLILNYTPGYLASITPCH